MDITDRTSVECKPRSSQQKVSKNCCDSRQLNAVELPCKRMPGEAMLSFVDLAGEDLVSCTIAMIV